MKPLTNGAECEESGLVKLYMDVTGATELEARSVFMYVVCDRSQGDVLDVSEIASEPLLESVSQGRPRDTSIVRLPWELSDRLKRTHLPTTAGA